MKNHETLALFPINLISPPASQTESSIALIWYIPDTSTKIKLYQIYLNGKIIGSCQSTDYTIENLYCDTMYEIYIIGVMNSGETIVKSNVCLISTKAKSQNFDITDFGAVGDGKTLNTVAIQTAINACTKGGTVRIPKGIFITGAIFLKSDMTFMIEEGGVILGSSNIDDYPLLNYRFEGLETTCYASLINAGIDTNEKLHNITISGTGKIDANGTILRKKADASQLGKPGRAICIKNADYVYLKDITVRHSPAWCVHLIYCNHISVNQINIYTRQAEDGTLYHIPNGDGIDPDSSSDVYIFHSIIASQDDCIAIKSGRDKEGRTIGIPSENIRITNCKFQSGFGVAVGSEMAGGVRNVLVRDCEYNDVYSIASIKAPRGRGGCIENISIEDITFYNYNLEYNDCRWFRGAIYIDQFYSHELFNLDEAEEFSEETPVILNISFKNITLDTKTGNAIYLAGLPESPLQNVLFENIHAIGKYGCKINNVRRLIQKNVCVFSREEEE